MHAVLAFKFQHRAHTEIEFMLNQIKMEIPTNNPEKWFRMNDSKKYFSVLNWNLNCTFSNSALLILFIIADAFIAANVGVDKITMLLYTGKEMRMEK